MCRRLCVSQPAGSAARPHRTPRVGSTLPCLPPCCLPQLDQSEEDSSYNRIKSLVNEELKQYFRCGRGLLLACGQPRWLQHASQACCSLCSLVVLRLL